MGDLMRYDVAIVGGGLSGATLALALSRTAAGSSDKLRILLLERRSLLPSTDSVEDTRALAISSGSLNTLSQLGLGEIFAVAGQEINQIHVSDAGHLGRLFLSAAEYALPCFGKVFLLPALEAQIYQSIRQAHSGIELITGTRVVEIQDIESGKRIVTDAGADYCAGSLLIAEGGEGELCQSQGVSYTRHDFQQTAIVTSIRFSHPLSGVAWERFTASGPLAVLPMANQHYSVVWTLEPASAAHLMRVDEAGFCRALQQAFGYRAGKILSVGPRQSFPLRQVIASDVTVDPHLFLLGNAAHMIHPVAGQGFNLTVRDIAEFVGAYSANRPSAGEASALRLMQDYHSGRMRDIRRVVQATSGLITLFGSPADSIIQARNLALLYMARSRACRKAVVAAGSGMTIT